MKALKIGSPIIVILVSLILVLYPRFMIDSGEVKSSASVEVTKGYNATPVHPDGGYISTQFSNQPNHSELQREIEISSDEIIQNDVDALIGTNDPFNARFITEDDVKASIKNILEDNEFREDLFDQEYLSYVVTLRHTEMTDHVPEKDSLVIKVAKEYLTKLGGK